MFNTTEPTMANTTIVADLPPLPVYTTAPIPPLLPFISDFWLSLIAPHVAFWVVSMIFHLIDVFDLFPQYRLHTPEEVVGKHEMFQAHCLWDPPPKFPPDSDEDGYWVPSLIPFASWDAYDLCIDAQRHDIWEFCPNIGLIKVLPSIASVALALTGRVDSGEEANLAPFLYRSGK